ncbi:hypothetical protein LHP98_04845 [Rhodobacter sp. Har01]|uniref:hypothetical protein n=1 Tax=Rhodobacter sp. Har01 TaxID=2883999 RepID=UPI001D0716EA|nr:hypothetical protein [Rhodobacter sp. Har01]MCB6177457.1 hypothetical protein [Rhodobacter sp. Har01]
MSNPDSFIQEVTEEVRRDRLFKLYKRFGWIGVGLIVIVVAGTAGNEWLKARARASAEAFGDGVIEALDMGSPEDRRSALAALAVSPEQARLRDMILASDPAENKAQTLAALDTVIADAAAPAVWRDLAVLRRVTVAGADQPLAERRAALEGIAAAGRPYRALAAEQLAYLLIEEGKTDQAIAALNALTQDQDATGALRARVAQVVTALGGKPEATEEAAAASDG